MREKDIKLLWGRSGNRCGICKLEITPDGQSSTIGEMAHIVARSLDGPRGEYDLSIDDRELYDNLILLCPNHHTEIDNNPQEWSVELLQKAKMEHEKWVSEQLDKGLIFVSPVDNSGFIAERIGSWVKFSNGALWVGVSITPLRLAGDTIDPINPAFIAAVNDLSVLDNNWSMKSVNRYHTRPNEYGLINDDLRFMERGAGHRIQIFRNGHCEIFLNLQGSVEETASFFKDKGHTFGPEDRVIHYTVLAQAVKASTYALYSIWSSLLPFKDMTFSVLVLNTRRFFLFSRDLRWGELLMGYPIESDKLHLSAVIAKNDSPRQIFESVIKQLVTYFGLVLPNGVFDETGEFIRPSKLLMSI